MSTTEDEKEAYSSVFTNGRKREELYSVILNVTLFFLLVCLGNTYAYFLKLECIFRTTK